MKVSFKIKSSKALKTAIKEALIEIWKQYNNISKFRANFNQNIFTQQAEKGPDLWTLNFFSKGSIKVQYNGTRLAAAQGNIFGWKIKKISKKGNKFIAFYELDFASFPVDENKFKIIKTPLKIWGETECEFFTKININGKMVTHEPGYIHWRNMETIGKVSINDTLADVVQVSNYKEFREKYANAIIGAEIIKNKMAWIAIDTNLL